MSNYIEKIFYFKKEMVLLSHLLCFTAFLLYSVCLSYLGVRSSPQAHDLTLSYASSLFRHLLPEIRLCSLIANSRYYTCFEYVLWVYDSPDTISSLHDISSIPFPEQTTRLRSLRGERVSQDLKLNIA